MGFNELFGLNDLGEGKQDKLIFPENIPVKMKITEVVDGILEKSQYPYYVLRCVVQDGDFEGSEYDLFVNTKYKVKSGEEKGTHTFKKVLGGLAKRFAENEIKEGRGNDLPDTFKTQIDQLIGLDIEIAFFKEDNGFQNPIFVRDLTPKDIPGVTSGTDTKQENF